MPTSAPGSSGHARRHGRGAGPRAASAGFTVIELLIVIAIVAVAASMISASLPDRQQLRLEEEGARLAALLETARVESRVSGVAVRWMPRRAASGADGDGDFSFVGLPARQVLPTHWLDPQTRAEIDGRPLLLLGPEPMLVPQRVRLTLGAHRLTVASDGLGPFGVVAAGDGDAAAGR